ncbi:MAG: uncharacterized protein PWQ82_278 [Thermosediminibacterales bacterium]|nr:uncharacterized protein [Thermosediminibacterales bacterium]
MPRPPKFRRVEFIPDVNYFKPAGIPMRELEEVVLTIDELEAVRLKDLEGFDQEGCAEKMQVSRPTFQRVLGSAREKIAEALVTGKAIRVEGGKYRLAKRKFRCKSCDYTFELPFGTGRIGDITCPKCNKK